MSIVQTKEIVVDKVSPPQDYVGHNKGERESAFKMQKMYLCQYLYIYYIIIIYVCLVVCVWWLSIRRPIFIRRAPGC